MFAVVSATSARAATFTVNDLGDLPDATPGDAICATAGAVCTLRAAIMEANAFAGIDNVGFSVAGTIPILSTFTVTDRVFISASTAPGYATAPVVIVENAGGATVGFDFAPGSGASQLTALEIRGFGTAAVRLVSAGVVLLQNYIGPLTGGLPNGAGVQVDATATGAQIGAMGGGFGNTISGNSTGISIGPANGTRVWDNRIGTNPAGTAALPNGVAISALGSTFTVIGGDSATFNVISGNNLDAIVLNGTSDVSISGNRIGTDITGLLPLANNGVGVTVASDAVRTAIGSATLANVISGNTGTGILNFGQQTTIVNSRIGVGADGITPVPNQWGIIEAGTNAVIGNATSGNVISGNSTDGMQVNAPSSFATIRNNIIGLDAAGAVAVPNGFNGISGDGANTHIGGIAAGEGNVISGNTVNGIGAVFSNAQVHGNIIGLNAAGTAAVPNGLHGIFLSSGSGTAIGTPGAGANTISGHLAGAGILIGDFATSVSIAGNRIGTDLTGNTAIPNTVGVDILNASAVTLDANVISGNTEAGVDVRGTASLVLLTSNVIGRNAANTAGVPNITTAVVVRDTASATIGAVGAGNVIASNTSHNGALAVANSATAIIRANSIFDNLNLGIDLGSDFVTANDPLDADAGPNTLQNYPVLTSTVTGATESYIAGTLSSTPSTTFTLDFFSSTVPDPSGFGEGETYLGSMNVTTDALGSATFTFVGPPVAVGTLVTSTATAATGTSEFSGSRGVSPVARLKFSSATYGAGESDGTVTITVLRSGILTAPSTVNYSTSDGTAVAGSDYSATSGTLTFAPGVGAQTFVVPVLGDTTDETDETVTLTLSSPTIATLDPPSVATLTITDDDAAPSITISDISRAEGNAGATAFDFAVRLSNPSASVVTVDYATADGTAVAGSDYTATMGTLNIPAGATTGTVSVPVAGESAFEADETFVVNLTNPTSATIGDNQAVGTIVNDDAVPSITISDVSQTEGNAGTTTFTFVVTVTPVIASDVSVDYATADGTATGGTDYGATAGTLIIPAGTASGTITVNVFGDTVLETDETFFVNLTAGVNATIGDAQGLGTIVNDDAAAPVGADVGITGSTVFTVSEVTFTLTVSNAGPAAATGVTVTDTIPPGTTLMSVTATGGTCTTAAPIVCTIPALAVGATETITIRVTPPADRATSLDNVATVTANEPDPNPANNTTTTPVQIPTLSEWMLMMLAVTLAAFAAIRLRLEPF